MDSMHFNPCPICEESFEWGEEIRKHVIGTQKTENEGDPNHQFDHLNQTIDCFPCAGLIVLNFSSRFCICDKLPGDAIQHEKINNNLYTSFVEYGHETIVDISKTNKGR